MPLMLRRKTPLPTIAIYVLGISVNLLIFESYLNGKTHLRDFLGFTLISTVLVGLWTLMEWGYKVRYSSTSICMRADGLNWLIARPRWARINFDKIERVYGAFGSVPGFQKRFVPFDHIRIEGDLEGTEDHLMISPNFLHVGDVRELMRVIYQKRPEAVSEEVVEFMGSSRPW